MEPRPILRKNLGLIIRNDIIKETERLSRSPSYERCGLLSPYQDKSPVHSPRYRDTLSPSARDIHYKDLLSPGHGHRDTLSPSARDVSFKDLLSPSHRHKDTASPSARDVSYKDLLSPSHRHRDTASPGAKDFLSSSHIHRERVSSNVRDVPNTDLLSASHRHRQTRSPSPRDSGYSLQEFSTWQKETRSKSPGSKHGAIFQFDEDILLSSRHGRSIDRSSSRESTYLKYSEDRFHFDGLKQREFRSPSPASGSPIYYRDRSLLSSRKENRRSCSPNAQNKYYFRPIPDERSSREQGSSPLEKHKARQYPNVNDKPVLSYQERELLLISQERSNFNSRDKSPQNALHTGQSKSENIPAQPRISSQSTPTFLIEDEKLIDSNHSNKDLSQDNTNISTPGEEKYAQTNKQTTDKITPEISNKEDEKMFLSVEGGQLMVQATDSVAATPRSRTYSVIMDQSKRVSIDRKTLERRLSNCEISQDNDSNILEVLSSADGFDKKIAGDESEGMTEVSETANKNQPFEQDVAQNSVLNKEMSRENAGISKTDTSNLKNYTDSVNSDRACEEDKILNMYKSNDDETSKVMNNKKFTSETKSDKLLNEKTEPEDLQDKVIHKKEKLENTENRMANETENDITKERRGRKGRTEDRGQSRRLTNDQEERRDRRSRSRTPVRFLLVSTKLETSSGRESHSCEKHHSFDTSGMTVTGEKEKDQLSKKSKKKQKNKEQEKNNSDGNSSKLTLEAEGKLNSSPTDIKNITSKESLDHTHLPTSTSSSKHVERKRDDDRELQGGRSGGVEKSGKQDKIPYPDIENTTDDTGKTRKDTEKFIGDPEKSRKETEKSRKDTEKSRGNTENLKQEKQEAEKSSKETEKSRKYTETSKDNTEDLKQDTERLKQDMERLKQEMERLKQETEKWKLDTETSQQGNMKSEQSTRKLKIDTETSKQDTDSLKQVTEKMEKEPIRLKLDTLMQTQDTMKLKQDTLMQTQDTMKLKQDTLMQTKDTMKSKQDTDLSKQDTATSKWDTAKLKQDMAKSNQSIEKLKHDTACLNQDNLKLKQNTMIEDKEKLEQDTEKLKLYCKDDKTSKQDTKTLAKDTQKLKQDTMKLMKDTEKSKQDPESSKQGNQHDVKESIQETVMTKHDIKKSKQDSESTKQDNQTLKQKVKESKQEVETSKHSTKTSNQDLVTKQQDNGKLKPYTLRTKQDTMKSAPYTETSKQEAQTTIQNTTKSNQETKISKQDKETFRQDKQTPNQDIMTSKQETEISKQNTEISKQDTKISKEEMKSSKQNTEISKQDTVQKKKTDISKQGTGKSKQDSKPAKNTTESSKQDIIKLTQDTETSKLATKTLKQETKSAEQDTEKLKLDITRLKKDTEKSKQDTEISKQETEKSKDSTLKSKQDKEKVMERSKLGIEGTKHISADSKQETKKSGKTYGNLSQDTKKSQLRTEKTQQNMENLEESAIRLKQEMEKSSQNAEKSKQSNKKSDKETEISKQTSNKSEGPGYIDFDVPRDSLKNTGLAIRNPEDNLEKKNKSVKTDRVDRDKGGDCRVITLTLKPITQSKETCTLKTVKPKELSIESSKQTSESQDFNSESQSNFGFNRDRLFAKLDPRGYKVENIRRKSSSSSDSSIKSPEVFISEDKKSYDFFTEAQSYSKIPQVETTNSSTENDRLSSLSEKSLQTSSNLGQPSQKPLQSLAERQDETKKVSKKAEEGEKKGFKTLDLSNTDTQNQNKMTVSKDTSISINLQEKENNNQDPEKTSSTKNIDDQNLESRKPNQEISSILDTKTERNDEKSPAVSNVKDRKKDPNKADVKEESLKDVIRRTRSRLHGVSDDTGLEIQNSPIGKTNEKATAVEQAKESDTRKDKTEKTRIKDSSIESGVRKSKVSTTRVDKIDIVNSTPSSREQKEEEMSLSVGERDEFKTKSYDKGEIKMTVKDLSDTAHDTMGKTSTSISVNEKTKGLLSEVKNEDKNQSKEALVMVKQQRKTPLTKKELVEVSHTEKLGKQQDGETLQKAEKAKNRFSLRTENTDSETPKSIQDTMNSGHSLNKTIVEDKSKLKIEKTNHEEQARIRADDSKEKSQVETKMIPNKNKTQTQSAVAKQTSSNEVTCISKAETQKVNTAEKSKTEKTISTEQQSSDIDKTKLLEDANVDTTKHTTKVTSPKQAREKPGDAFGGKTVKVDLKKAREKLQNNKTEDKTLKMETDKEKTQKAEQNLMVIDKSSLLSDGTKKQQTSPKSLPKHDRFEQIEEPTKITSSSYSPKSRTKISKNDSSDETEQINFKDTIDNIKTNLKSRPKQSDSKERLMQVKKEISYKSTKTENKTEELEMYKIDSSQQKDDKRILSSTKNTSEENTQEKTLLKGKDTKITVDESDTSKKDDKTTQIPHFDKDRSKVLPGDRDSINTADLQTKREESSKKKDKSNSSGKNSKENKDEDSSDRKMSSLEITDKEPGHNEEKPNWKKLIKVDKMKSKEEKSNPTLKDIISQTRNKLQKPPKVTDLLQPEPGQDVQDGQVEIGEDKVIGKQTNTEAPSPLNAQNTEILNKSTQSILANHKQGINDDIKVLKQDNESSNEDSGKMKTLKQTEKDISFNLKTEELKTNEVKLKMGEHQKIKMLENNSSRKLANRALEEENSRSLKSASDNMTKILDKQTLEVSTKQPEEKSKNRHHKSKTTDGKTIVLDPGNTKSNSTTDVKLGSRADDKVHITHNTEVGAKESKLVNQEKESNEMCQGTLALYTHRKKQSQAKIEAEVKGVTEPQSNLDRKNETSRGKTNLKTTSVAEKHTEGKKSSRAELHTGDKSGSSFDQHSVNNEGIKDEKNICAYTQQEKSFVNKQSNKTIGVTKGLEETAIIKPDVSDESPRNKDNKRASTSKGSNKKTKVLKEFVVINEVKPVSDGDILQTGGAANKMKDLSERGEEATVINLKPVSKKVTLQESDIKNEGESEQVKDLLRSREKSIDVDKKSGKDALSGIENGSSAPPEEPQPKKKELAETEDKKSLSKTDNKNGVSKKDELQTKTKSRHKFELPLLKSSKVKADSVAPEKTSKQNSITIEEKPGKGFLNTEGNSNLKETLDQKAEMSVNLKSTKADKQVSDGVSKSKSALKVKFDTEVKYSSGNEVNENLNRKHSKDSKAGTSKSSQDDKDVKHSGGSPIQNRKKVAQDNGQGGPKQNGKKQEVCSDPGVLLSPKGSPKENRKKLTAGSDQNGSPKQNRKKLNTASDPENNGLQKKVHFKDVDKDYQRKVYAQEVAKKIQTSIIADMRSKLRSKAAAIEKHQERIKAKEAKTQEKSSQPVMSTAQAEVKETSQLASKPAIKLSPETPTESPDNRKTQGVSTSTASEKSKQELITAVKTIEKTDIVKENQTKDKGKAEQKEDLVTENKETKSVKQNEKVTEKYKNDSKKNEEKSEGKQNVSSSPILVTKNRDMSEDISRGEQANQGVFDVSKFITNTKIKEFKKELKTDDQHQEKEKKLSGKDIQITRGVESNQRNDIQFISTSFSGPESPTSAGSSKDDQKSPEFTYQKFDFDESSESKSHSSDSTVRADQVSDEEEVGEGSNEDIMAELRKLLPLEIFSSRRRHRTEDDEDVPCDCCECQGSSEDEYSMDGRMPQLSVIGEEDEETVSVFDPDKMDSEEMQFHRTFMEKVYSRNPRASKVFNPGVIVSSSDSEESEEVEESDDSAFDSMKRPVFDIEAFLKYTGNVEDWLERIEEFVPMTREPSKVYEYKVFEQDYSVPSRSYIDHLTTYIPPRLPIEKPELYTISPESVTLTWKRARVPDKIRDTCNLSYTVEVRNPPNLDWRELVTGLTTTNTDLKGLHPRLDYLFRIRAWNEYGCSEPSLPVSLHRPIELSDDYDSGEDWDEQYRVTLGDLAPPKLPMETPRITDSGETAMLSWLPARIPAYAKKTPITYIIEIKEPHVPGWSRLTSGISDTSYFIEGLRPTQDYQFRVKAETQYGVSDPTLPASLDRPKEKGRRLEFLPDMEYYELFKRDWNTNSDKNKRPSVDLLREDIDLPIKREPTPSGVPPRIPSSRPLITQQLPDRLSMSWMPARVPSYVKNQKLTYVVEIREPPSTLWRSIKEDLRDTEYDVSDLNPDQDYLFRVRARNEYGLSEPTMPASVIRNKDDYVPHVSSRSGSFDSGSPWIRSRASSVESLRKQKSFDFTDDESDIYINREKKACPPEFKSTNEDVHYGVAGTSCKVTLGVKGYPLPTTSWFFMGAEVDYGDNFKAHISPSGNATLEIIKLTRDLIGEYKCTAENEHGTATKIIKLELADQPTVLDPLSDLTLDSHQSGKLVCRVDGLPYPTVKFLKDSRPLTSTSRLRVDYEPPDTWTLTLDKVITTDSGTYTCVAENMAGKSTCSAKITVEENEDHLDRDLMVKPLPYRETFMEDHYHVLEEIGRGRHGIVHRVLDKFTGSEYAAKFIHVCDEHQRRFFRTELNILRWLNQQGVPKLVDAFITERRIVIITEIVTNYDIIDRVLQDPTPTESLVATNIKQLLLVIKELHKASILHLDIKPSNIRFSSNTNLTLIDFGFSERLQRNEEVKKNYGTAGFCSPEQVHNEAVTEASDVWAIGATVYTMLTGLPPFPGSTQQEVLQSTIQYRWQEVNDLSPEANDFLSKILIRDPKERMTVDGCLSHPWIKNAESQGGVISRDRLSEFQTQYKLRCTTSATRGPVRLQPLLSVLEGKQETGIHVDKDSATGELSFPESGLYGEFLDQESWFDWQSRYYYGLDADESDTELESVCGDPILKKEREWLQMAAEEKKQLQRPQDFFPKEEEEEDNPQFTIKLHDTYYRPGDVITLSCHVTSSSTLSVSWFQNEELVTDGKRMKTSLTEEGIATLVITSAKAYDDGIYKCTARNKTGKSSTYARVMVGETPPQPGRPVISQISSCDVLLLWEPPENDGNSDIISYRVDYRQSGSDRWCLGTYSINECALVTGLSPSTSYRFRVCCTNNVGDSPYSVSSVLITTKPKGSADISLDPFTISQLSRQHEGLSFYQPPKNRLSPEDISSREITLQTTNVEDQYSLSNVLWRGNYSSSYVLSTDKTKKLHNITKITPVSDLHKDRLSRELEILRTLRHERFVQLYDAYLYMDRYYWIMEYLSGVNVVEHFSYKSKYTEDMVAIVIRQVLDGLQFLHYHGYAHLNIQPSSVMMVSRRRLDVRIVDFSLVQKVTKEGQVVPREGNPEFMAPEVVVKEMTSYPADIWSVGVLTFLLLSGESPYKGQDEEATFTNVAYNRYNALSLYENITKEALKFIFRVLKRVSRNRMTASECLDDKWLQTSETMLKFRTEAVFSSVKLRNYVTESFLESIKASEAELTRLREKFLIRQEVKVTKKAIKEDSKKTDQHTDSGVNQTMKKEVKDSEIESEVKRSEVKKSSSVEDIADELVNGAMDEALKSETLT